MVITVLKSLLPRLFASRTRFAIALGTVVAAAAITVPVAAGAASAATSAPRTVTASSAASFPATMVAFHCWSMTNCMAVGANFPQMATQVVAERWNGTHWSRSTLPKPAGAAEITFSGVACPSRTECVAVGTGYPPPSAKNGESFPFADYWNGSRWRTGRAAAAGTGGGFAAVSCSSARNCYAVGEYTTKSDFLPLIEHWNGSAWSRQNAPVPSGTSFAQVTAVSCPSAKFCVAVGTDGAGELIEHLTASGWSKVTPRSASSAILFSVSCPSASSCFAVGSGLKTSGGSVGERWNGRSWSAFTTPVPRGDSNAGLEGVSCVSASRCLAVGSYANSASHSGVYADSWNGSGWHQVSMTTTGGHIGDFYAVDCTGASSCAALAGTTQFTATARSESAFWNGTRWKVALTA
jgi:hypothetical protein